MADESSRSDVAARYAQALFELAADQEALGPVEADLKALETLARESADLRLLLRSPKFDAAEQARALAALSERAGFAALTRKFLGLLAANRRLSALGAITAEFRRLAAARRGLVAAEVTTAAPMSPAQHERLSSALAAALGKAPQIEVKVDPAILGGLKVKIGSRLYDASLKAKLDSMKFALARA
ncbi:MAG TPA: F0F1 ATP synthase subunit delta [Caulobacteraceae bacterium]|nr:F0F1 ATP synthase subunit delta [Caulobacteraceae bacterium]